MTHDGGLHDASRPGRSNFLHLETGKVPLLRECIGGEAKRTVLREMLLLGPRGYWLLRSAK